MSSLKSRVFISNIGTKIKGKNRKRIIRKLKNIIQNISIKEMKRKIWVMGTVRKIRIAKINF